MPIVNVSLLEGYDDFARGELLRRLTDAVRLSINAPLDSITVVLSEVPPSDYRRGGRKHHAGAGKESPEALVRDFQTALKQGSLDLAETYTDKDFTVVYPSGKSASLREFAAWSATQFRDIAKDYAHFDEAVLEDGSVAVYCGGTLVGQSKDRTSFDGIPFIEHYVVREGKLIEKRLWTDVGGR
ncbi:MAG: 4-oxalocrotonate tautomerase family protein [Alphaproteobacteria bacterium]